MPIDIVIGSHHDHFWLEMMQKYVYILCEASTIAGASLIQYNKWTEFALLPMRQRMLRCNPSISDRMVTLVSYVIYNTILSSLFVVHPQKNNNNTRTYIQRFMKERARAQKGVDMHIRKCYITSLYVTKFLLAAFAYLL